MFDQGFEKTCIENKDFINERWVYMPEIKIYGASDDLIEIEGPVMGLFGDKGVIDREELDRYRDIHPGIRSVISIKDASGEALLHVYAIYGDNACWTFAPALVDEDKPFPSWDITFGVSSVTPYSMEIRIQVPHEVYAEFDQSD